MIQLTEDQSRSIKAETPTRVVADGQEYVLVRADVYEHMKEIIERETEEIDPSLYEFDEVEDSWGGYVVRFFAGFCLMANGAYIGVGSFDGVGDAGDLIRHGAAIWHLWLFGLVSCSAALLFWHRLGAHFGLGEAKGQVNATASYVSLVLRIVLIVAELVL